MIKYFLYILLFILSIQSSNARISTNAESLELLSKSAIGLIIENINLPESSIIVYSISQNLPDFLLEKDLLSFKQFYFFSADLKNIPENANKLTISTKEFNIEYLESPNNSIERNSKLDLTAILEMPNGQRILIADTVITNNTVMDIDLAERLNTAAPRFAKGQLPNRKRSVYEKIIQPAMVITAAVLTVVLFFSVRSK